MALPTRVSRQQTAPSATAWSIRAPRRVLHAKSHSPSSKLRLKSLTVLAGNYPPSENGNQGAATGSKYGVLSIFCPLLKMFAGDDPSAPRNRFAEVAASGVASITRLPFGTSVGPASKHPNATKPEKLLCLYEFEACPFCRRTREAITDLDLDVLVYPCPKGSVRHRKTVLEKGGMEQFPFMEDPNTGVMMYESDQIVSYLYQKYGGDCSPPGYLLPSTVITGWMPTLIRAGRGMTRWEKAPREAPEQPLELWNYDGNQFARLVREALCELEIPYILRAAAKGSPNREALREISGGTQVPFLVDPNTQTSLADSEKILSYLFKTYGP